MRSLAAAGILVACSTLFGTPWAVGVTDCSAPSSSVLSLQAPLEQIHAYIDEETVVEGRVKSVPGRNGRSTFLLQSSDGTAEVLAVAPLDVDMTMHEGELVRVEGTLEMSHAKNGVKMLLVSEAKPIEQAVQVCQQPAPRHHRNRRVMLTWVDMFGRGYEEQHKEAVRKGEEAEKEGRPKE